MFISRSNKSQAGAALITALVLVMLVTIIAAKVQKSFFSSMTSLEVSMQRQQAMLVLDSTPKLVASYLEVDDDNTVDSFHDFWLQGAQSFPVDDYAVLSAQLFDASSLFNVNALLNVGTRDALSIEQRMFVRLLQALPDYEISQQEAVDLTFFIHDWLDSDDLISDPVSAESSYYQSLSPNRYRAANQLMHSVTELKFVKGIDARLFRLLRPFVVALPNAELSINLNTASMTILRMFNVKDDLSPLDPNTAQEWILARENAPFSELQLFLAQPSVQQLQQDQQSLDIDQGRVNSAYLLLHSDLNYQGRLYLMTSLLSRSSADVTLLVSSYGEL